MPIDKQADTATVSAGGLAGYQITVRNRGRTVARNLRVCDRIPRRMTFVRADRKLGRLGARTLPRDPAPRARPTRQLHLDLRVDANAPPGTLANIADIRRAAGLAQRALARSGPVLARFVVGSASAGQDSLSADQEGASPLRVVAGRYRQCDRTSPDSRASLAIAFSCPVHTGDA